MSTENRLKELKMEETTDAPKGGRSSNNQISMSGGLTEWLGTLNQSRESVSALFSENQYPRSMSVAGQDETRLSDQGRRGHGRESQLGRSVLLYQETRVKAGSSASRGAITPLSRFRLSAAVPFVLSAAAFSFSLVLVLAGSKTGQLTNVNIISFNTTNLGTGILEFGPTTTASATTSTSTPAGLGRREISCTRALPTEASTTTPAQIRDRDTFNPLDPLGLVPALSSAVISRISVDSSVLASAGGAIATLLPNPSITLPGFPIPTGSGSGNGSTTSTGLLGTLGSLITSGLTSLLSPLLAGLEASGITQAVDDALNSAFTDLISGVVARAGVQDYYSLYVLTTCQGNSASNISSCSEFSSAAQGISNISDKIPTSLAVLGTNVSSPALGELTTAISSLGPLVNSLEKFFLALMILSLINSAAAILLSLLGIVFPQNRIILYANVSLASIGFLTRIIDAILATTVSLTLSYVTNKFGNALGVSATTGGVFIALVWLGFVFQSLASTYWLCVWFVEFRKISFRIRTRDPSEIGDYKGIVKEIKSDIRSPKEPKQPEEREKHFVVV